MKIHAVEQGTPEWFRLRLGKPSASRFKDVVTPKGKPSASADKYLNELLAEKLAMKRFDGFDTFHMKRGRELEPQAASVFEFQTELACREIGFVTDDREQIGCSPDRLVGGVGLEIKCPMHTTHIGYLRDYANTGQMPSEYYAQVQGTMWIMGFDWYYFMSYHPDLPNLIIRVQRDDEFIAGLSAAIEKLLEDLNSEYEKIGELNGI